MYAISNITYEYGKGRRQRWVMTDDWRGVQMFETRQDAVEVCNRMDESPMQLSHNEYSSRYYVRKLTAEQEARLAA